MRLTGRAGGGRDSYSHLGISLLPLEAAQRIPRGGAAVTYKARGVRRIRRARRNRSPFVAAILLAWLGAALPAFAQAGTAYFTVTPCRVLDTRNAVDPNGFGGPALAAASTRVWNLAGQCGISTGAQAVAVN